MVPANVREAARDARSNDDLVRDDWDILMGEEPELSHPLDEETLDERYSTQMGPGGSARRDAN